MPRPYRTFTVVPSLPKHLQPLTEIAYNLWWCWNRDAIDLFRRLDRDLWESTHHNPILMLGQVSQARLEEVAHDEGFLGHMRRVAQELHEYLHTRETWFQGRHGARHEGLTIAYFSMEFGLTDCIPMYSGGLGVLAGDHLRSASDLGVPLVGVSLVYQFGYFQQYLNADGWQGETYPPNDLPNMPLTLVKGGDGQPVTVEVAFPGRTVAARVWCAQVGRVPLYLLDANLPTNREEDRAITERLYGGDLEMRIRQEILLGIGGYRALRQLGISPTICHMNEGHSAFLALERIRWAMREEGLSFDEARTLTSAGNVFTTHTIVPAGIDLFPPEMMGRYFGEYIRELGLSWEEFMRLGRAPNAGPNDPFSMAVLALSLSGAANGVSGLHGEVARRLWQPLWPGLGAEEVPIGVVANGVHHRTWVSRDMAELYRNYCGPDWLSRPENPSSWEPIRQIPDEELWRIHERRRNRLVAVARQRLRQQAERRGASPQEIAQAASALDPNALTIGFARRFATYKRALLLFRDPDRLSRILNDPERPVQIIFSGKAHPNDTPAKEFIRQLIHLCRRPDLQSRVIFLENYDLEIARYLVQGVDVWLNTPRRGLEASGTSGMKACMNGVIHLSTLDGWWEEGYSPEAGWRIGNGETYADENYGDEVEANALYDLLEKEIVPLFYDRGHNHVPHGWVAKMKNAICHVGPRYNTHRMVQEYVEAFYLRGAERYAMLHEEDNRGARDLAAALKRMRANWGNIHIRAIEAEAPDVLTVRDEVTITVHLDLGALTPEDVLVQAYYGPMTLQGELDGHDLLALPYDGTDDMGYAVFKGTITYRSSGLNGFTVRILPRHPMLGCPFVPGLILWAS